MRARLLLLAAALLGSSLTPGPAAAQAPGAEARVLDAVDERALEEWATRRLEALGEDPSSSALPHSLEILWAHYFLSVARREAEEDVRNALDAVAGAFSRGSPEHRTRLAIEGAVEVIRGRNSRWPPNKLEHVRKGLEILDGLVQAHPGALEVRYLRLVSCYYLPFFFDREKSVEEDMRVLVETLPRERGPFPPTVYRGVVAFVLENGELTSEERILLRAALG